MSNPNTYPSPVDKLLTYGDGRETISEWPDYRQLGLGPEHVDDLIKMVTDEELNMANADETPAVWAPLHAWRALGQLQAEAAIEPLIGMLYRIDEYDNDWISDEMPRVFGMIGPAAIEPLGTYLKDPNNPLWARIAAARGLEHIAKNHPKADTDCVATLAQTLKIFKQHHPTLNAYIVASLAALNAVEAANLMEEAFEANNVDDTVMGDWEDVQVQMGLLDQRQTPRTPTIPVGYVTRPKKSAPPVEQFISQASRRRRNKSKRKQTKQSRKQNRRKDKRNKRGN